MIDSCAAIEAIAAAHAQPATDAFHLWTVKHDLRNGTFLELLDRYYYSTSCRSSCVLSSVHWTNSIPSPTRLRMDPRYVLQHVP